MAIVFGAMVAARSGFFHTLWSVCKNWRLGTGVRRFSVACLTALSLEVLHYFSFPTGPIRVCVCAWLCVCVCVSGDLSRAMKENWLHFRTLLDSPICEFCRKNQLSAHIFHMYLYIMFLFCSSFFVTSSYILPFSPVCLMVVSFPCGTQWLSQSAV